MGTLNCIFTERYFEVTPTLTTPCRFPDLFNVIMDFGEVCDEGVACASDVDDDGTVQVRDLLTVLQDLGDNWPPSTSRFKAWTWAPVTMTTVERMAPFVWAASWVQPETVAAALNAQPQGDRVLFFFANITNSLAEDDLGQMHHRCRW